MDPLDCIPLDALHHRAARVHGEVVRVLVVGLEVVEHDGVTLNEWWVAAIMIGV